MFMDTRSRQNVPVEAVMIDLKMVEKTFVMCTKPKGHEDAQGNPLTPRFDEFMQTVTVEEEKKAKEKGLTTLQWKLRELFREILEQEFTYYRDEQDLRGMHVSISGLTLQQRMEKYPRVAERALIAWIRNLGISHLYVAENDSDTSLRKIFSDNSGLTLYEHFYGMLCSLY